MSVGLRKLSFVAWVSIMVAATAYTTQAQTVITTVRIKSLNQVVADINTVANHLGAPPMGQMAIPALTGKAGSPSGTGVNLDKPASLYLLMSDTPGTTAGTSPMAKPPSVVMVLPLSGDGSAFVNTLGETYPSQSKEGSLTVLTNPDATMPGTKATLYMGREAGYAVTGDDAAAVKKILARLREKAPSDPDATISATIGIQAMLPMLESAIAMGKMATANLPTPTKTTGPQIDTTKVVGAELDLVLALARQVNAFNVRLSAGPQAIELVTYATLVPGSLLAKIQAGFRPVSDRFKGLVPADAYVAMAGNGLQVLSEFTDDYFALVKPLMEAVGSATTNFNDVMESQMALFKDAYSGDYSLSIVPSTGAAKIGMMECFGVKDADKFKDAVLKGALNVRMPGNGSTPALDVSVEEKARSYDGHDIIKVSYGKDALADDTKMASAMAEMPALGMFMSMEVCCLDDVAIMAWGGPDIMDKAIDLAKKGGSRIDQTAPYTSLYPVAEKTPITVAAVRVLGLVKAAMQMAPHDGASPFAALGANVPETHSGIAGYSHMVGDKQVSVCRIGYDELAGLSTMVKSAQQATMNAMGGQMGGGMGGMDSPMETEDANMEGSSKSTDPKTTCISQLRMIDAAKELYSMENNLTEGADVPADGLLKFLPGGVMPKCPLGNVYTIGAIGTAPSCAAVGHKLP